MWLTALAGLAFGVIDVLAPLRLGGLGAGATLIGLTFLLSAAIEAGLAPLTGQCPIAGDRCAVRISLTAAVVVSLLAPVARAGGGADHAAVIGMPAFGALFTPAMTMLSAGADKLHLNQGLAFGLSNLAGRPVGSPQRRAVPSRRPPPTLSRTRCSPRRAWAPSSSVGPARRPLLARLRRSVVVPCEQGVQPGDGGQPDEAGQRGEAGQRDRRPTG